MKYTFFVILMLMITNANAEIVLSDNFEADMAECNSEIHYFIPSQNETYGFYECLDVWKKVYHNDFTSVCRDNTKTYDIKVGDYTITLIEFTETLETVPCDGTEDSKSNKPLKRFNETEL